MMDDGAIRQRHLLSGPSFYQCRYFTLEKVNVVVNAVTPVPLGYEVDESYTLAADRLQLSINANTTWGALAGLEAAMQLFGRSDSTGRLALAGLPLHVKDKPSLGWRGILLDTSRHFFTPDAIRRLLDGAAMTRMNVLHWHITDDQARRKTSQRGRRKLEKCVFIH